MCGLIRSLSVQGPTPYLSSCNPVDAPCGVMAPPFTSIRAQRCLGFEGLRSLGGCEHGGVL